MNSQLFEPLPLVDFTIKNYQPTDTKLSEVAIISVQHLLETTGSMFEAMAKSGIDKSNIFILGKLYSNNARTIEKLRKSGFLVLDSTDSTEYGRYYDLLQSDCKRLWRLFLDSLIQKPDVRTIIILDDGGMLLRTAPEFDTKYRVVGVEQTSSGMWLTNEVSLPIINVARSAVKTRIEPAFISQAVINKTRMRLLDLNPKKVGVIGYGCIGQGIVSDLCQFFQVMVHDINEADVDQPNVRVGTLEDVYQWAEVIIGATGRDISYTPILSNDWGDKTFLSVSSGDIEFNTLLKEGNHIPNHINGSNSILNDLTYKNSAGNVLTFLRGGTPVNFDNNIHSVLPEYIQLTRALLILGVFQGIQSTEELRHHNGSVKLDPRAQVEILEQFISQHNIDLSKYSFPIEPKTLTNLSIIKPLSEGKAVSKFTRSNYIQS